MTRRRALTVAAFAALILAAALAGALVGAMEANERTVERKPLDPWIETLYSYDCGDRP